VGRDGRPVENAEYGTSHTSFPNESTADQFFDEAQWESYRRLGEHAGAILFAPGEGSEGWTPHRMVAGTGTVGAPLASTAGADVQANRLEVVVRGWGREKVSWCVDYRTIVGDVATAAPWRELEALLATAWRGRPPGAAPCRSGA
jgi:hypothetical protein